MKSFFHSAVAPSHDACRAAPRRSKSFSIGYMARLLFRNSSLGFNSYYLTGCYIATEDDVMGMGMGTILTELIKIWKISDFVIV